MQRQSESRKKASASDWLLIIGVMLLVLGMLFYPLFAKAHDWYPIECCSGMDCAPVDGVQYMQPIDASSKLPRLVVTTKIGTTIVPADAKWRESKDGKMHACIKPHDKNPTTNFICIFAPPTM